MHDRGDRAVSRSLAVDFEGAARRDPRIVADRGRTSRIDISPNQSPGPRSATRVSVPFSPRLERQDLRPRREDDENSRPDCPRGTRVTGADEVDRARSPRASRMSSPRRAEEADCGAPPASAARTSCVATPTACSLSTLSTPLRRSIRDQYAHHPARRRRNRVIGEGVAGFPPGQSPAKPTRHHRWQSPAPTQA